MEIIVTSCQLYLKLQFQSYFVGINLDVVLERKDDCRIYGIKVIAILFQQSRMDMRLRETIEKAEGQRTDALNCGVGEDS